MYDKTPHRNQKGTEFADLPAFVNNKLFTQLVTGTDADEIKNNIIEQIANSESYLTGPDNARYDALDSKLKKNPQGKQLDPENKKVTPTIDPLSGKEV